jgi:antitoxin component of MazEF toxin-antitoxin module
VLAVRLPQALSELLHLQQGDRLTLQLLSSGELLLTPCTRRSRIALAHRLQQMQARLPLP